MRGRRWIRWAKRQSCTPHTCILLMTFHPSSTPKMGMYLDSLGNSSWSSTSNVPFSYLMACRVIVTTGLSVAVVEQLLYARSSSTGSYVAPVTVICADFAVSGGPVRSVVVFVVLVTGHATSHTFNTYINTQQLPPPPLLLWLATTEVPTTYYRTLSTILLNASYYEYDHWLPCDGSVTIAGARSEHYCCNGDRRRRSAHQTLCVTSVATSETALSPLASRQGTVGSLFVRRLFPHSSPRHRLRAMAEVAIGGVYSHTSVSPKPRTGGVHRTAFAVHHRPVITRSLRFPDAVSRPSANGLSARANQPFPLARLPVR